MTTSRNLAAFQEIASTVFWEMWKVQVFLEYKLLRTPKTNPLPSPTGIRRRVEIREFIYGRLAPVQLG